MGEHLPHLPYLPQITIRHRLLPSRLLSSPISPDLIESSISQLPQLPHVAIGSPLESTLERKSRLDRIFHLGKRLVSVGLVEGLLNNSPDSWMMTPGDRQGVTMTTTTTTTNFDIATRERLFAAVQFAGLVARDQGEQEIATKLLSAATAIWEATDATIADVIADVSYVTITALDDARTGSVARACMRAHDIVVAVRDAQGGAR